MALGVLTGLTVATFAVTHHSGARPFEDAAMLMRYAQHFAHGYGITWNIGHHPTDGATDFLWMVVTGGITALGLPVASATLSAALAAHVATMATVYAGARRVHQSSRLASVLAALYLIAGPGMRYVDAFFGTSFFGLLVAGTWFSAYGYRRRSTSRNAKTLAALALLLSLSRPEGVLLAGLILGALVMTTGWERSALAFRWFVAIFGTAGTTYFCLRWAYFGHPLPNPFYVKGGGHLYLGSLRQSAITTIRSVLPVVPLGILTLICAPKRRAELLFPLIPVVGFCVIWALLSNETNFLGRFQYPIVAIVAVSIPALVPRRGELRSRTGAVTRRLMAATVVATTGFGILWVGQAGLSLARGHRLELVNDSRCDIARSLSQLPHSEVLATSEAGLLPLYSGWTALDTWGLNDEWIAHHGSVSESYLDRYRPDLIVFHAYFPPWSPHPTFVPQEGRRWNTMTVTLFGYAQSHHYALVGAFGPKSDDLFYYFVRPDGPFRQRITTIIAHERYLIPYRDGPVRNYA